MVTLAGFSLGFLLGCGWFLDGKCLRIHLQLKHVGGKMTLVCYYSQNLTGLVGKEAGSGNHIESVEAIISRFFSPD